MKQKLVHENQVDISSVLSAEQKLKGLVLETPLAPNINFSRLFGANILFKREDLQPVRSYKIRGAANMIGGLGEQKLAKGIVCASAGNHAQGVAYACNRLKVKGTIFMPTTTPAQKVKQVNRFGNPFVEIILVGDTFDEAKDEAISWSSSKGMTFVHPFDDPEVIAGQGTVGLEILKQSDDQIDYLLVPVGGGGLSAGLAVVLKALSPNTKLIGVEPEGAASMSLSMEKGLPVNLDHIDTFVDGAAVKQVGKLNFSLLQNAFHKLIAVPEGKVCSTILQLYNEEAIVVEPAGALAISALDQLREEIKDKNVVCVISGSNNDITRTEEIRDRALLFEGLKHYFIVKFAQRPGALKEFVNEVLGPRDDITHFEYVKKNNKEKGAAIVGIEMESVEDLEPLLFQFNSREIVYEYLNERWNLFRFLI